VPVGNMSDAFQVDFCITFPKCRAFFFETATNFKRVGWSTTGTGTYDKLKKD